MQRRSDHDHLSLEKPWQPSLAYGRKDTANLVIYVKFPTLHVPHATKNVFIKLTMLLRTSPLLLLPPTIFSLEEKASASMFWAHLTLILICQKDVCVWYSFHTMRSSSSLSRHIQQSSAWNCYDASYSKFSMAYYNFFYWRSMRSLFDLSECVVHHTAAPLKAKVVKGMDTNYNL